MKKKIYINNNSFSGKNLGIIGGGQLARMLGLAAANFGIKVSIFEPNSNSPAFQVANEVFQYSFLDKRKLRQFANSCDAITYEFENIPIESLEYVSRFCKVYPGKKPLKVSQDRLLEKKFIKKLDLNVAKFYEINNSTQLKKHIPQLSYKCILKTRRLGYDGKGQIKINKKNFRNIEIIKNTQYVLEEVINFKKELSVIVIRDKKGKLLSFMPSENLHKSGILRESNYPASISIRCSNKAIKIAEQIASALNIIGILAVEMFLDHNNRIIVNEIAPRPHNSGHWTIDACDISQFEALIRVIFDIPFNKILYKNKCKMINLLGENYNIYKKLIGRPNYKIHLYGKNELKPLRKMGHINILSK